MNTPTLIFSINILLDIFIVVYAFSLVRRMGKGGLLKQVTFFLAFSALIFGIHHMMELLIAHTPLGADISESIEAVAAILLGLATIQLYRMVNI